ncbi:branched-chain amino acid ABC transporter permease [Profundibacter sp.]
MDWVLLAELTVNGALTGLLYSLVAIGLVLIYKSSAVPNLAQGALTMTGAYVVLAFSHNLGWPLWVAIPLAMVIMFFLGVGIERVALRRLAGRPIVMILMMTMGIDIFLRGTTLAIWGGTSRSVELGVSYDPFFVGDILLSRIHIVGAGAAIALLVASLLFFRSRLGIRLRAISDDYLASWSVGISVERGVGLSWGLASIVAVVTGVIWGEVQGVDQTLAALLLKGLAVAVLGGLDSIIGAVVAGIILGVLESVGSFFLDDLVGGGSRDLIVAAVLILTVMIRPHGLFGRHDIERV